MSVIESDPRKIKMKFFQIAVTLMIFFDQNSLSLSDADGAQPIFRQVLLFIRANLSWYVCTVAFRKIETGR